MSKSFTSKTATIITGMIVGLVVVSFVFTFDAPGIVGGGNQKVGSVGGHDIKIEEFQREYSNMVQQYQYFSGGKPLPAAQESRIKFNTMEKLIGTKILLVLAEEENLPAGDAQIMNTIKNQEYFKTENQFDFIKYKQLLAANRFAPADYEKLVRMDVKAQNSQKLLSLPVVSKSFLKSLEEKKQDKREVSLIQIRESNLVDFIQVSSSDIKSFLSSPSTLKRVQTAFDKRKSTLGTQEQVKARHILFTGDDGLKKAQDLKKKLTPINFAAMAKKHSQGPTNKKGGDLGWFAKEAMDPAFSQMAFSLKKGVVSEPVQSRFGYHLILVEGKKERVEPNFDNHKNKIATELIRSDRAIETARIKAEIVKELQKKKDQKAWEKINKEFRLSGLFEKKVDLLSSRVGFINLDPKNMNSIFKAQAGDSIIFEQDGVTTLALVHGKAKPDKKEAKNIEEERTQFNRRLTTQFNQEIVKHIWENTSVKCGGVRLKNRQEVAKCPI